MSLVQYAILNDIHFPYEGQCYYQALELMRSWPDLREIYLNGDIAEIESMSTHPKSPLAQQNLLAEIEYVNQKLDTLAKMFPGVKVHYICGNHEYRIYRFIRDIAPQMWGLAEAPTLLKFNERPGFRFYDYGPNQLLKVGATHDLWARHEPLGGGKANPARFTAEHSIVSLIFGHTHIEQSYTHKKFGPKSVTVTAYSNGFLGDIKAKCFDYRGPNDNWQEGFSRIDCDEDSGLYERRFISL